MTIKIIQYNKNRKKEWNDFLNKSKYQHFFFNRNYIDSNKKLNDYSLMFYKKGDLYAIMPANLDQQKKKLLSHQGLSFAGIIKSNKCKVFDTLDIFKELILFAKRNSIFQINYKLIPFIYSLNQNEDDKIALNYFGFKIKSCEVSSYINLKSEIKFSSRKKRNIKKFEKVKDNFVISSEIKYLRKFWKIVEEVLLPHNVKPTHTFNEIKWLFKKFPNNVKLFVLLDKLKLEAISGVVIFENDDVVHTQYIASTKYGKDIGSNDFLISYLINNYKKKFFFSFGRSTDEIYEYKINKGLLVSKEEFGASCNTLETYILKL